MAKTANIFSSIVIALLFLCVLFLPGDGKSILSKQKKQRVGLLLLCISLFNNCFWQNTAGGGNAVSTHKRIHEIAELTDNETLEVKHIASTENVQEFYRFSGDDLTTNANITADMSSTQFYWSLANPFTLKFREKMELMESKPHKFTGYDGRAGLLALSSVRYYSMPNGTNNPSPYGFSETNSNGNTNYHIYRNDYALPLSYTYDSYMTEDTWDRLSAVEKQETMLKTCILEGEQEGIAQGKPDLVSREIDYKLTCKGDGILLLDNAFVVTSANAKAKLTFSGIQDSENYLSIQGLAYKGTKAFELYFGGDNVDPLDRYTRSDWEHISEKNKKSLLQKQLLVDKPKTADITFKLSTGASRTITYDTPEVTSFNNRHDFTINLGYSKKAAKSMTIKFKNIGIYSFDSIQVACQPMGTYKEQVEARKADTLEHVKIDANTVTGSIFLKNPKLLCFAIPYSEGWEAYVDGEKAKVLRANVQYMAVKLDEGEHEVRLVYATPFLKEGAVISAVSFVVFAAVAFWLERRRKKR